VPGAIADWCVSQMYGSTPTFLCHYIAGDCEVLTRAIGNCAKAEIACRCFGDGPKACEKIKPEERSEKNAVYKRN
jgi:hypothetical protein